MSETEILKNMVMSFRVSELTMLLSFAGRSRSGRKTELQTRALELIKLKSNPINAKVRELYRSIQQQTLALNQVAAEATAPYVGSLRSAVSPTKTAGYSAADIERAALQARNPYISGVSYPSPGYTSKSASSGPPTIPVHPDVRLKKLPFFDCLAEILRPSSLVPQGNSRYYDANFVFHLTPQQATDIASSRDSRPGSKIDYLNQIQLRFCYLETSCEQEDNFPSNLSAKVNGKLVTLPNPIPTNKPGVEPKRPPRPVNITSLCKLSPTTSNQINVTWTSDMGGRGYVLAVYLVRRLTSSDLLQRLKGKGVRQAEYTRGLIKEKLEDADAEIATTSLKVSLVCPLGKMRMQLPCRATSCSHLQCFDASLFLQMNERKPTWICPVCDRPILYDNLAIDGYFSDILNSPQLSNEIMDVELNVDGTWTIVSVKKETKSASSSTAGVSAVDIVDDAPSSKKREAKPETIDEGELELVCEGPPKKKKAPMVVDLTLSSDSEDETSLLNIKERERSKRQRSPSCQSSRPSTADSVATSSSGTANSNSGTPLTSNQSGSTNSLGVDQSRSSTNYESTPGINPSHYSYLSSGNYGSPTYFPYSSPSSNGPIPYRHAGYSYGSSDFFNTLFEQGADRSQTANSATSTSSNSSNIIDYLMASNNSAARPQSSPDIISLD